jgi:anti-sigma factor RsiW
MELLCPVDGEVLSRFLDGELPQEEMTGVAAHLKTCAACDLRLSQFRLADGLLSRVRSNSVRSNRLAASVSIAAALLVSVAGNILLAPGKRVEPPVSLTLSAAPSDTLATFYARVAPRDASSSGVVR